MTYPRSGANVAFASMIHVHSMKCSAWENEVDGDTFFDMKLDPETGTYYWVAIANDLDDDCGDDAIFMHYQRTELNDVDHAEGYDNAVEAFDQFLTEHVRFQLSFRTMIDQFYERIAEAEREATEHRYIRDGGVAPLSEGSL
jgi:hypothetical protein